MATSRIEEKSSVGLQKMAWRCVRVSRQIGRQLSRIVLFASGGLFALSAAQAQVVGAAQGSDADQALIARGHYLATAADCAACHTANGGKPFAGGYAIASPLGTIYSSNITPSKSAGIGDYSEADFARALREGVRRDGKHLYPGMPYTSYTGLSDEDVHALYAYFMDGVAAVDKQAPVTALPFPFNIRASMAFWNLLFLKQTRFTPDPSADGERNRGAYLVNNLAHCAECHTPRNALMALNKAKDLTGGAVGSWYAPNITNDPVKGIGQWTDAQLLAYLKTGRAAGMAQAAGPMAEAVTNSLQYLSNDDLQAIVVYLRTVRASGTSASSSMTGHSRADYGSAHSAEAQYRGVLADASSGAQLYSGNCAACHRADGSGSPDGSYPALFGNTTTGAPNADNLVSTILNGVDRTVEGKQVLMPGFGPQAYVNRLSFQEVADLSNYVLKQYGNASVTVSAQDVATIAKGGPTPLIATLGKYVWLVLALLALLVLVCVWLCLRLTRRARTAR